MIKKIILWTIASFMLLFTIMSAASAYSIQENNNRHNSINYYYYGGGEYEQFYNDQYYADYYGGYPYGPDGNYARSPIVAGPYPRYYLGYNNMNVRDYFLHDDFDHYDNFVGYRDLDVYNPDGSVDVIRNPYGSIDYVDPDYNLTYRTASRYNVHGVLPGGAEYVKHYYHDHAWDLGEYDYGYDYGYFTPADYRSIRPVYTHPCSSGCN